MQQTKSNITYCTRENQINKLIKDQVCCNLLKELEKNPPSFEVNIVNSFDTPHSFVIWSVTGTPALVTLEGGARKTHITKHVTDIYKRLKLEK